MFGRRCIFFLFVFFFKQKTAYEISSRDWSSDVCSSDLAPRQVRDRFRQSLQDRAERGPAAQPLHQLVTDVAGVEIGEDKHVRPSANRRTFGLARGDVGDDRRVGLQLAVEHELRRRLAAAQLRDRGLDALDARAFGAAARAVRQERHDRLVPDDAAPVPCRRNRDVRELDGRRLRHDGAVGEGQHAVVLHHVEGTRHRRDARRHADRPERGVYRVRARIDRAAHHHVGGADAHQTGAARKRMFERLGGGRIGGKPVGTAGAQMLGEKRRARVREAAQDLHDTEPQLLDPRRRFLHAWVVSFGEDDARPQFFRPLVDAFEEAHLENLRFSACWTVGSTSGDTSPPKRATSRTRLELTKVRSNAGTGNTVSILGARLRFINAIWNSYSKSETARSPRIITEAPSCLANSASNPSNDCTAKRLSGTACRISATRSSSENSGCFTTFTATATMS